MGLIAQLGLMTDAPRISCTSPARESAEQYYASAPIGELAIELMRLSNQPWTSQCTSCYRIALEIAAKRMLDFNGAEQVTREQVLKALAQ